MNVQWIALIKGAIFHLLVTEDCSPILMQIHLWLWLLFADIIPRMPTLLVEYCIQTGK